MNKAILIDSRHHAVGLKRYLDTHSPDFSDTQILELTDLVARPGRYSGVRYLFSTWNMPFLSDKEISVHFPALKAVFYAAGDASSFSGAYNARGVRVFSAQRENAIPVAEFVLGQVLLANKGYFQARDQYKRGFWRSSFRKARTLSQDRQGNFGAKIGIIGFGAIGSLLAERLKPFNFKVVVHDPFVDDEKIRALGSIKISLEELFETCDVISNHLPDVPETRSMLNYRLFSMMKPTATFINTGRGRQVDEKDLVRAMRDFPSRSALLDVTCHEPPLPFSALYRTRNIFLSPHIAGSQGSEIDRLYHSALHHYIAYKNNFDCQS